MNCSEIFTEVITAQKSGKPEGIYSICSANKYAIKAAMRQARQDGTPLLIESTCNQVNQYGGYTGMTPEKFVRFVKDIADKSGFAFEKVILGGDHLGPNVWRNEKVEDAMEKAAVLVRDYVKAGFKKIHLDTSMRCADDNDSEDLPLDDEIIAERTARLCQICEATLNENYPKEPGLVYVIGSDVPIPGGNQGKHRALKTTAATDAERTIEVTKQVFFSVGLQSAWERVIAVVVQPGIEFGNSEIIDYSHYRAQQLSELIEHHEGLVFEAHSTDYQLKESLRSMVKDHFAILKVGPWLTYAFREAVFSLAAIEYELSSFKSSIRSSQIRDVIDEVMCRDPEYWKNHYRGNRGQLAFARKYSYSDRVRYYWVNKTVSEALDRLFENLHRNQIPLALLSQYMPGQYRAVRDGSLSNTPEELVQHKIREVTGIYSYACGQSMGNCYQKLEN